jgi:hypothetical protein
MYKALQIYRKEFHWFCKGCSGGAERLLTAVSKIQNKMEKLEYGSHGQKRS